jgi:cation:H+ antiporter
LIGLLTALAADGPEISSALFALVKGVHSVSVGVLVGSNTFNIAAMVGVSALLAGRVRAARATLAVEGSVGAVITALAAASLLGWLSPALTAVLGGAVLAPYLVWISRGATAIRHANAATERSDDPGSPTHHLLGLIVLDAAVIIAGSFGMVQAALTLASAWHISSAILGAVLLGPLTSIPNAQTGIRLGRAGRGEALVGEMLNSNAINLGVGVIVPGLFVTLTASTPTAKLELGWLVGMTAVTMLLLARKGGLTRFGAILLVALYVGFLVVALS